MVEWVMIIALIVFAVRVASEQNESGLIWGIVTFGLCFASQIFLPQLPFARILIAAGALLVLWLVVALIRDKP